MSAEWMFDLPRIYAQFWHVSHQSFCSTFTVNSKGFTDSWVLHQGYKLGTQDVNLIKSVFYNGHYKYHFRKILHELQGDMMVHIVFHARFGTTMLWFCPCF